MKTSFPLFITLAAAAVFSIAWTVSEREPGVKLTIHGTVYQWNPNQHYYRSAKRDPTFIPFAAATLYARRINYGYHGIMPICDTIVSDSLGHFTTQLEKGEYDLFEPWQLQPLVMPKDSAWMVYDTACIRREYNKAAFRLRISNDDSVEIKLFPGDAVERRCRNSRQ